MDMFHTAALPSHCCTFFGKDKKHYCEWLQIIFKWSASAKSGYTLGAVFRFLVLIMSHVLAAGISGLGLHRHFNDQKFLWHRRGQLVSLSFPSYGPFVPTLSPAWALMFVQLWGEQGRARGWPTALGRGAVRRRIFFQQFLALADFS